MANPYLFQQIKTAIQTKTETATFRPWSEVRPLLPRFYQTSEQQKSGYFAQARTKQWLRSLTLKYQEAKPLFDEIKIITKPPEFKQNLERLCL
jgi:tRNA-dihydrouridine synthase C